MRQSNAQPGLTFHIGRKEARFRTRRGPKKEVAPNQLDRAIGPDVLATLSQQTGLSREEILARLSRELPTAVDKYTPEGRLPTQQDLLHWS